MTPKSEEIDLLQAARCEDLQYGQIRELSVLGDFERKVIANLKGAGAHLLQGAREFAEKCHPHSPSIAEGQT
jgi:hypothetical protein